MNVPLTPLRCLERALDLFADRVGIVCGDESFTYAQFGERCRKLACAIQMLGVQPGDRVAFLSFNTHRLLEGYYGVPMARAIVMPLNVRLSLAELTDIFCHSGARVVFSESDFAPLVEQLKAACPGVVRWITLDTAYEDLLASASPAPLDIFAVDENDVAELFYTSGSTGTPKGVMLTHRNLYMHALEISLATARREAMVDLHTIPLFHANGWGRPQSSTMLGNKQVMVRRFDPSFVFQSIQQHRATDMSLVPTMANMLLNSPDLGKYDISSMREIMIGGAAASPELIARLEAAFQCRVVAGYGLTETCPALTTGRHKPGLGFKDEQDRYRRQAMAGWPLPGVRVRVVDIHDSDVPRDGQSIGEIVAQGDVVTAGYYKDQAATDAVIRDNWFHTGDMAVWDAEGYVHIVDRKKEIIISGGENISSLEVERAIYAHESVLECAVVSAPDERWGEIPAAIVALKPGRNLTESELLEFLQNRLGRFKLPRLIEFTDEPLPKTGTGKVRKLLLRERFWSDKQKRVQG